MSTIANNKRPRVLFVTLGCAKNEVDTDRMRALLQADGFDEGSEVVDSDVVVINTCSFLAQATSEGIETTLSLADEIADGVRTLPIVMCGCIPSRYGDGLAEELPEVAAFVRSDEEDGIASVLRDVLGLPASDAKPVCDLPLRTVEGASAFVKISDGCDRFCSFCAIPYIRGRYASRPASEILSEVRELMAGGVREIILIGQDTGIWGSDFEEPSTLACLLSEVAREVRPFAGWVRVLYLQPEGMTDELIAAIRDINEVLPYIDIPIQHCNAEILRAMNRSGSTEELHELFSRLRREIPNIVLRTTGMAGFPGETDEQFDELCHFLEEESFDYCSVFAYSQEEGTAAARLEDQVPEDLKLERTQRLHDISERSGFAATASHIGEISDVIIDGVETSETGTELIGHAWFQAPDSDGVVHITSGDVAVGDVVRCRFDDAFCYELVGTIVDESS